MIGRLTGLIAEKHAPDLLIDVNGVGYEVQMPMSSFYQLPALNQQATIYIHFVVREDAQLLYGFANKSERALFRELIKVNGVGPKMALTILSGMSAEQFVQAVSFDDVSSLVKLPGVGKKTAERLLIEMRDQLKDWQQGEASGSIEISDISSSNPSQNQSAKADAISALLALGFKAPVANKAINQIAKDEMSSEEMIKESLKLLS